METPASVPAPKLSAKDRLGNPPASQDIKKDSEPAVSVPRRRRIRETGDDESDSPSGSSSEEDEQDEDHGDRVRGGCLYDMTRPMPVLTFMLGILTGMGFTYAAMVS
jgi:hypothetical protein